jgi:tryptophan synthase alpha chain
MEASPSAAMMGLAMPLLDGLLIHPDGQRTTLHQGLVVLFPVADLVLAMVAQFRTDDDATPVVLMGYLNPIMQYGFENLH